MPPVYIGTPLAANATRVLLLGAGELGKEIAIELQRLGVETVAVDRYANAPAMQVAHRAHVLDMMDPGELRRVVEAERPAIVIPEVEAIATAELVALEAEGWRVAPTAKAVQLTMNRAGLRRLAAEELGVPTSPYRFADSAEATQAAVAALGAPCLVKPVMSSSGRGQSTVMRAEEAPPAWEAALADARGGAAEGVIVEGFVEFDYEITLLAVRHTGGVSFCEPIGHRQERGDYRESWQPQPMASAALAECQRIAALVGDALGGFGVFGMEFFVQGEQVLFSEASPRPHDTGLVTLASQDPSEFALHTRAVLGLPIPAIRRRGPAASAAILAHGDSAAVGYADVDAALAAPDTQLRLFGKPEVRGERRMGVALALGESVEDARAKARGVAAAVGVEVG